MMRKQIICVVFAMWSFGFYCLVTGCAPDQVARFFGSAPAPQAYPIGPCSSLGLGNLCGLYPNCYVCSITYQPTSTDATVSPNVVVTPAYSTDDGGIAGSLVVQTATPPLEPSGGQNGGVYVVRGDGGTGWSYLGPVENGGASGALCLALPYGTTEPGCGSSTAQVVHQYGGSFVNFNSSFGWAMYNAQGLQYELRPDVEGFFPPAFVFKNGSPGPNTGTVPINFLFGVESVPANTSGSLRIFSRDSANPAAPNGDPLYLSGGAAYTPGDAGIEGPVRICLEGAWVNGVRADGGAGPNNCTNTVGIELGETNQNVQGVGLGQMGQGMINDAGVNVGPVSGLGWTWFAPAINVPDAGPETGTQCYTDPISGSFKCWRAGSDAAVVVVP